jgi:NADH:ubiquinone oxidoreductase subunit
MRMALGTNLFTYFKGKHVGTDALGNRYFTERRPASGKRARRWVMYKGEVEPSRVPPEWHGWLHYTHDTLPTETPQPHYAWQKPPKANMSGTTQAYVPTGHLLKGGKRAATTADYEPWTPN